MTIKHINPPTLHQNPAFTQVATVTTPARFIYVGGQNAVDKDGNIVGDDIGTQTEQAYKNVIAALEAAGATMADVFKMTIYMVQGNDFRKGYEAVQRVQPMPTPPPPSAASWWLASPTPNT